MRLLMPMCTHMLALRHTFTHSHTHTLTLLPKNASRRYRCMRISELIPDLLWELEVAQTWLMANRSKRNVRTERNDP